MAGGAVQHSICGGLVAVAMLVPACADATILTRCGLLADLQPLADASTLLPEEQSALATVRSAAEADNHEAGRSGAAPPTVHNFNSLLIAINPGLAKGAEFGTRSLIVATRINGVTYSFLHPVHFLAVGVTPKPKVAIRSMTSMMTTRSWTMKSG
jgi:hypothetical protein